MDSPDALTAPFKTWQAGLLRLAISLHDPNLERIVVARLEATATAVTPTLSEIGALALLVPSSAQFDRSTFLTWEPDPRAVSLAKKLGEDSAFQKHMDGYLDGLERHRDRREAEVSGAFPEHDARRLLKDTIFGFSAAELSDVTQRLGEADPFDRVAKRLSLWFKPSQDYSRYGLPLPESGRFTTDVVRKLVSSLDSETGARFAALIRIWSGDAPVEASEEAIKRIPSLLSFFHNTSIGGIDSLLALEILGALADDLDKLDIDSQSALSTAIESVNRTLGDGRPATADYVRWITSHFGSGEALRLAYDPSSLLCSIQYADDAHVFAPILEATLESMHTGGISSFPCGPIPIRGSYLHNSGELLKTLMSCASEVGDLHRLLSIDGDYQDSDGPYPAQCYWTGELDPGAITFPEAIDAANERADYALCDMLIGCWTLFCALYSQSPLPDVAGLARRINALPLDHRSSTYAALSSLKREALENPWLSRDVEVLTSWLPLVDTAPVEDLNSYLQNVFSARLWRLVEPDEVQRLFQAERLFITIRRQGLRDDNDHMLRSLVIDWSAVAESFLRRTVETLINAGASTNERRTLGKLIGDTRSWLRKGFSTVDIEERSRMHRTRNALDMLDHLNQLNSRAAKHLGGGRLTWSDVTHVHASIYWALKVVLDIMDSPPMT